MTIWWSAVVSDDHRRNFFTFFRRPQTWWSIQRERISNDQGWPRVPLGGKREGKVFDAILQFYHTPPRWVSNLSNLSWPGTKNGTHFMPFETLHFGVWVFRWACNINIHKTCGSIWSQEAPGVRKTFSNSLLNGRSKGPVKSNGVIKCKSGQ